ncbi:MAG TPA: MarR family transcriptional regulator, partial [Candidatus Methanoperedens sp.]
KLLTPAPINIFMDGSDIVASHITGFYTLVDMSIVSVFSCLLGISATYLLFFDSRTAPKKNIEDNAPSVLQAESASADKSNTDDILKILKGNDRKVTEVLVEFGEMNQTELASRANIPKSTLSRALSDLEKRGLIIRYENGMSKMVKLAGTLDKKKDIVT